MKAIGIDLGATKTLIALVDDKGRIHKSLKFPTPKNRKDLIEEILIGINSIKGKQKIKGVSIGVAAFLNEKKKIMLSPNMPFLNNFDLRKKIEEKTSLKCLIENDVNCFGLAEALIGNARKYNNVFALTIGSGIGSALIVDKKIYHGKAFAVEAGHLAIHSKKERKCACGKKNCIEAFASATAMLKQAKKKKLRIQNAKELCESKNAKAKKIIEEASKYFGLFLNNIVYLFDPEVIVLGGGLANCKKFIENAKKELKKTLKIKRKINISKAFFKEEGVVIGAGMLLLKKEKEYYTEIRKPVLTVDGIIKHYNSKGRFDGIVLIKRKFKPKGLALPGGIVDLNETVEEALKREMLEETGLKVYDLKQFKVYSNPKRDKRFHAVSVVFSCKAKGKLKPGDDAIKTVLVKPSKLLKKLCFDHTKILKDAKEKGII